MPPNQTIANDGGRAAIVLKSAEKSVRFDPLGDFAQTSSLHKQLKVILQLMPCANFAFPSEGSADCSGGSLGVARLLHGAHPRAEVVQQSRACPADGRFGIVEHQDTRLEDPLRLRIWCLEVEYPRI